MQIQLFNTAVLHVILNRSSMLFRIFGVCLIFQMFTLDLFADWKLGKPESGKKISLEIDGKNRTYWKLSSKQATKIIVNGPGELKVITRLQLAKGELEGIYSFISWRDGKDRELIARATSVSKISFNPENTGLAIGESRTILYDIPPGKHAFKFKVPENQKEKVYVRFLLNDRSNEDETYIAYLPRKFPQEVKVVIKEKEYIYYRSNSNTSIELEVIGPTTIKCISRLEFNHTMHGEKPYRVQVKEGHKPILTTPHTATISGTASLTDRTDTVLSKGSILFIDVPKGKHTYRISTPDHGLDVLFRFYLPQSDLGNRLDNDNGIYKAALFNNWQNKSFE